MKLTDTQVTDVEILDLLETVLHSPYSNPTSRQLVLASITKISSRPRTTEPTRQRILQILQSYETSTELEIQQRSVEFAALFAQTGIRAGVLEEMPPPEVKSTVVGVVSENKPVGSTAPAKDVRYNLSIISNILTTLQSTLVDLMGDDTSILSPGGATAAAVPNNEELLSQIFGGSSTSAAPDAAAQPGNGKSSINDILNLFGPTPAATTTAAPVVASDPLASLGSGPSFFSTAQPASRPAAPAQKAPGYVAYDKNSLKLTLNPQVSAAKPGVVLVTARFEVTGPLPATGVNFQAAVPKVS